MKSAVLNFIRWFVEPFGYEVVRPHPAERPWSEDPAFMQLYEDIQPRTVVSIQRLYMLYQFAKHALSVEGDVAEVGVYKGGTAKLFASVTEETSKNIHLFDTFEGMPTAETHTAFGEERSIFTDTSVESVRDYVADARVTFHKGIFPDTAVGLETERFSLVYLDADLYESTKDGLAFFWPKMTPGGVIVIDDYGSKHWFGIQEAVQEFAAQSQVSPIRTAPFQCAFIKS